MDSKIGFEMSLIVVGAIRGRCASFTVLTATVSEIFGGQTNSSILVVQEKGGSQGVHEKGGSQGVHKKGGSREPCEPLT